MARPFRITGKHVLGMMIGFFAVIILANAIFITFAVRSFPGEQEEKSYLQGIAYNEKIDARAAQAALQWAAAISSMEKTMDGATIELSFTDHAGAPLDGLAVEGVLARPATDASDIALAFAAVGAGRYRATASGAGVGAWRLEATASRGADTFALEKKIVLE